MNATQATELATLATEDGRTVTVVKKDGGWLSGRIGATYPDRFCVIVRDTATIWVRPEEVSQITYVA